MDKRTLPKTEETIKLISETKTEQGRQELIEGMKSFKAKHIKNNLKVASHRKSNHITLDEFKQLVKEGKSLNDICLITSKHLAYFYSVLLKGKINLSKEEFEKQYIGGMSLEDIAKANNIPREHITYLRDFYGIKRKGAKYLKRINNEQPLSQEAKDIIIGSLLGDGHITKGGYFSEKHSCAQLGYLQWKASFLTQITTDKSWGYYERIDKRSGTLIKSHQFRTTAHNFLYEMRNLFYKEINGQWIKIVPSNIEELMNEKVLAIGFMDDGSTDWRYRKGVKQSIGSNAASKISSEGFSLEDNLILQKMLLNKFNINSYIKNKDGDLNKPQLIFSTIETQKLIEITGPFATTDLLYKFNEENYVCTKMIKNEEEK